MLFTLIDERLMFKAISFARRKRAYLIFGQQITHAANRLADAGLLTIQPAAPKTSKQLVYHAVRPTKRGREVWNAHCLTPNRKPRGGNNRQLSLDALVQTIRCVTVHGALDSTAHLNVTAEAIAYRLKKARALAEQSQLLASEFAIMDSQRQSSL